MHNNLLKLIELFRQGVLKLQDENEMLRKRISEFEKDKEIQDLKEQIQYLQQELVKKNIFEISLAEEVAIKKWKKHNNLCNKGAGGGSFIYEFIPTSIGVIGTIKHSSGKDFCFRDL